MIALLGATGYVGQAFVQYFSKAGIAFTPVTRGELNYYDWRQLAGRIDEVGAEFVINAAGFTGKPNVDACEEHKVECLLANSVLPGLVRQACEHLEIPWGHVSSGCIYTDVASSPRGFRESDTPNFTFRQNNCSFYSGTKALAEELLSGATQCYIWRLRLPFNHVDGPRNYLSKLMRYERLVDVRNSLSHLDEAVSASYRCWAERLEFGTYHLTNGGSVTTREVVAMLLNARLIRRDVEYFESETEFLRVAVQTPRSNCVLDNSKALAAGLKLSPVHTAIARALDQWVSA